MKFNLLSKYDPCLLSKPRNEMNTFVTGGA